MADARRRVFFLLVTFARATIGASVLQFASGAAMAQLPDQPLGFAFGPRLITQYDTNVERLPADAAVSSWINEVDALAGFDHMYGRQHVTADALIGRVWYSSLPIYNFTHESYHAGWYMSFPKTFNSEIDVFRSLDLANFADYSFAPFGPRRNIISQSSVRGALDFPLFAQDWRLVASGDVIHLRNSNGVDRPGDTNTYDVAGGIRYTTGHDNRVDLVGHSTKVNYPHGEGTPLEFDEYRENGADVRVRWKFSGASIVYGHLGYDRLNDPMLPFRDFSGPIYDLSYAWTPTYRSSLTATLSRVIGPTGDNAYLWATTHVYRLAPAYILTSKVTLEAHYQFSEADYSSTRPLFAQLGPVPVFFGARTDRVHTFRVAAIWKAQRWLRVELAQLFDQRNSNPSIYDYEDRLTTLSAQATF